MSSLEDDEDDSFDILPETPYFDWNILLLLLLTVLVLSVVSALIIFITDALGISLPGFVGNQSELLVLSFQEIIIAVTATTALFGFLSERQKTRDQMIYEQRQELKEKRLKNLENRIEWALREFPTFTYLLGRMVTAIREVREAYFYDLDDVNIRYYKDDKYRISLRKEDLELLEIDGQGSPEEREKLEMKWDLIEKEKMESVYNLLFQFGKLRIMEEIFRSEQGQMFRFMPHNKEITAQFLFDLGVEGLGFHSNRMNRKMNFTIQEEMYLIEKTLDCRLEENMKGLYSMTKFLHIAETDPIINRMADQIKKVIGNSRGGEWAEKNFDVLSRYLNQQIYRANEEIDRIYQDETLYSIPSLSYPDRQYIDALRKISTIFVSLSSMKDENEQVPLRIWIYNHWDRPIKINNGMVEVHVLGDDGFELPMKLYRADKVMAIISALRKEITNSTSGLHSISYDELRPKIKQYEIRDELASGETAIALWSRRGYNNQPVKPGNYKIVYLPREEDIVLGWTSAYAIDFIIHDRVRIGKDHENKIEQIKIQDWRMRHSFQ